MPEPQGGRVTLSFEWAEGNLDTGAFQQSFADFAAELYQFLFDHGASGVNIYGFDGDRVSPEPEPDDDDGTSGQDRDSYSDDQDRESYVPSVIAELESIENKGRATLKAFSIPTELGPFVPDTEGGVTRDPDEIKPLGAVVADLLRPAVERALEDRFGSLLNAHVASWRTTTTMPPGTEADALDTDEEGRTNDRTLPQGE